MTASVVFLSNVWAAVCFPLGYRAVSMTDERGALAAALRQNASQWRQDGSEFYAVLSGHLADDVDAGGPCWPVLKAHAAHPLDEIPGVRLLAGVHRLVLQGRLPDLAAHYPSVGGDGVGEAAWPLFHAAVAAHADELAAWVDHVPQTNEVGRSIAIIGGWLTVAAETALPLRLLEPGTSAGLNLRCDHYWYESHGRGWGDPDAPVRFVDRWDGGQPPFDAPCRIADRRGCDRYPIDATTDEGRVTLLAYVFADETERFETLRAALEVAARTPVAIDRSAAPTWLESQLATLPEGQATVVFHSFFWQYLAEADARQARTVIEGAGERATSGSPLAWLSLEERGGDYAHVDLRLRLWPGGDERLLATCLSHPHRVDWKDAGR